MSNKSSVSTEETPKDRPMSIVTEEGGKPSEAAAGEQPGKKTEKSADSDGDPKNTEDDGKKASAKDPEGDGEAGKKKRTPSRRDRRINRLRAENETLNNENERLRRQLAEKDSSDDTGSSAEESAKKDPKPSVKDFDDYDDYIEALTDWKIRNADSNKSGKAKPAKSGKGTTEDEERNTKPQMSQAEIKATNDFRTNGIELYGDEFLEVVQDQSLNINKASVDFMIDSEVGPEILMYLDENREEADDIYELTPRKAMKKLEAIEAKLAKKAEGDDADDDKDTGKSGKQAEKSNSGKISKAPEPAEDAGGGTGGGSGVGMPDNMDDYAAMRRKQERSRGR